jgi:serine/threonine protein kinase
MENGNLVGYLEENPLVPRKPFVSIIQSSQLKETDLYVKICDVVKGLEYLHRENIVHGDLKGVQWFSFSISGSCLRHTSSGQHPGRCFRNSLHH